jgi:Nuclease-related domain
MFESVPIKYARRLASQRRVIRMAVAMATICLVIWISRNGLHVNTVVGLVSCLFALYGIDRLAIPFLDKLIVEEKNAIRGAEAEDLVGSILDRLPKNYTVIHNVPTGFGDIDHLVFRDDGAIFVVETKSHQGHLTVRDGQLLRDGRPFDKDFIKQTLGNVKWVKDKIAENSQFQPTWIHAAVVFTRARVPLHCEISNVAVIRPSYMERWMAKAKGNARNAQAFWPKHPDIKSLLFVPAKRIR